MQDTFHFYPFVSYVTYVDTCHKYPLLMRTADVYKCSYNCLPQCQLRTKEMSG